MIDKCRECGSYAVNHHCHGRDGSDGDLCDVCYWKSRTAELLAALEGLLDDMHMRARIGGDIDSDGRVVLNCGNGVLCAAEKAIAKAKGV